MKHSLTVILICLSLAAGAQATRLHRIDSMRIALTYAKEDTAKVKLLLRVGRAFIDDNTDETIRYAQQAMDLAEKLGDKKDMALAANQLGNVYNKQDKYFKALKNYQEELEICGQLKDSLDEGMALFNIGLLYSKFVYLDKAEDNYDQAKEIAEKIGDKPLLAYTTAGMGYIHLKMTEYTQAIDCYKQALEIYKSIDSITTDNKKRMADVYHKLAWLYFQKEQYNDAEGNALQALALSRDIKYTQGIQEANGMLNAIHAIK